MKDNVRWLDESDAWRHVQTLFVFFGKRPAVDYTVSKPDAGWLRINSNELCPKGTEATVTSVFISDMLDSRVVGYEVHLSMLGERRKYIFKCRNTEQAELLSGRLRYWLIPAEQLDEHCIIQFIQSNPKAYA